MTRSVKELKRHAWLHAGVFGMALFGLLAIQSWWVRVPLVVVAVMSAVESYFTGKKLEREETEVNPDNDIQHEAKGLVQVEDSELTALSDAMRIAVEGLRDIQSRMDSADEEFEPAVFVATEGEEPVYLPVREFFVTPEVWEEMHPNLPPLPPGKQPKNALFEAILPKMVAATGVTEVVLVAGANMLASDTPLDPDSDEFVPPSENPDAIEVVMINQVTPRGVRCFFAPVGRDPLGYESPTLASFEEVQGGHYESALDQVLAATRLVKLCEVLGCTMDELRSGRVQGLHELGGGDDQ